jgi:hypothetical protein
MLMSYVLCCCLPTVQGHLYSRLLRILADTSTSVVDQVACLEIIKERYSTMCDSPLFAL